MNCARDGLNLGIVFGVVREVDKEVILLDDTPTSSESPMADSPACVVKVIKKFEIQVLCMQHNPVSFCATIAYHTECLPIGGCCTEKGE